IYYCSLGAFENGISKIKKYTGVETVTGRLIEESEKVLDGKLYSQKDRQKIRKIVEKYDGTRIPTEYSRGYDNCQLLYAFENNIPNNSLGLLWFSHNWTPLLERK
ncbi:MAG: phosphoribosyltransferase-like protein, partial [Nitrososphaeraceae archaeon]